MVSTWRGTRAAILANAVSLALFGGPWRPSFAETRPPNFLWITCEDLSPDLGCYGDSYAQTPNIDAFARQGTRFTWVFTHAGVCAPSRSGLITGRYPTEIGTHHMRCEGVPPSDVKCFTEYLRSAGYFASNNYKTDYNFAAPESAWDESGHDADWRHRAPGQPFFHVVNFMTTHEGHIRDLNGQFVASTSQLTPAERHDPDRAELPPYYPDTPVTRLDWARYHDLITALDHQVGDVLRRLDEDGLADETIVFFFSDHGRGLPRAKRWLYDSGTRVPLIARWPGRIQANGLNEELVAFVDFAPTMLSLAGISVPSNLPGRIFLGSDRGPPREYVYGARDRMDERRDTIRSVRDKRFHYLRNYHPEIPYAQPILYMEAMPTMRVWRRLSAAGALEGPSRLFFRARKPIEELYDTERDPHEIVNLAGDPKYQVELRRLRAAHETFVAQFDDLGFIEEEVLWERARPRGEWSVTATPRIGLTRVKKTAIENDEQVELTLFCETPGASIVWSLADSAAIGQTSPRWRLYSGPIRAAAGVEFRAKACRLGFLDSAIVEGEFAVPR